MFIDCTELLECVGCEMQVIELMAIFAMWGIPRGKSSVD